MDPEMDPLIVSHLQPVPSGDPPPERAAAPLGESLRHSARGDEQAFAARYDGTRDGRMGVDQILAVRPGAPHDLPAVRSS